MAHQVAPRLLPPHQLPPPAAAATGAVRLCSHPDTPQPAVMRIHIGIVVERDGRLSLHYHLRGRLDRLRIPTAEQPAPADRLWAHTCFEVFIGSADAPAYREFNFSPSGQWANYAFSDYRERDADAPPATAPEFDILRSGDLLMLSATLPAGILPASTPIAGLRLGLSTVVEAADGTLSYWALAHPADKPDFHDARGFCWTAANPTR